ncbi:MAG: ribosome recycling factor [Micavibrio sp.]
MTFNINDLRQRMEGAVNNLKEEFAGLRTGRAAASMLEPVTVEVYGSRMPINQLGTVTAPEPRMLSVQVWDATATKAVEKAIRDSGLGLNPIGEGSVIRVPIPELNQERRAELTKVASKYAEQARVAVRNIRRDGMDLLKKLKSDGMPEDENKRHGDEVQKLTDSIIQKIDTMLKDKEKDIMTV